MYKLGLVMTLSCLSESHPNEKACIGHVFPSGVGSGGLGGGGGSVHCSV